MAHAVAAFTLQRTSNGYQPSGTSYDGTNAIAASENSLPIWTQRVGTLSIQVSCPSTGTPNGSFSIQGCDDSSEYEGEGKPGQKLVNWSTLSFFDEAAGATVQSKAVAGAQSFIVTIPVVSANWLRFVWTNSSGSALLAVTANKRAVV